MANGTGSWYEKQSRGAKRGVVGGATLSINVVAAWAAHDIFGLDIPPEVIAALGGFTAGAVSWVMGGGVQDLVVSYYAFKRRLRDLKAEADED